MGRADERPMPLSFVCLFGSKVEAKKIVKAKVTSAEALTLLWWAPLHARRFGHRCCLVQGTLKGEIPEHLDVFSSTMSQQHGYN